MSTNLKVCAHFNRFFMLNPNMAKKFLISKFCEKMENFSLLSALDIFKRANIVCLFVCFTLEISARIFPPIF